MQVALTRLQLPLVCMRAKCMVGIIRLGCNTLCFMWKIGLEIELTQQL